MDTITWVPVALTETNGGAGATPSLQVSKYPATVDQFRRFVEAHGYENDSHWSPTGWTWRRQTETSRPLFWNREEYNRPNLPITGVSYWEAEAFARFSNARLPTENEWYSIASNNGTTTYPWGNDSDKIAEARANLGFFGAFRERKLVPVTEFPDGKSERDVWDLLGNVSEWCELRDSTRRPDHAVLRGGCSWHSPFTVTSESRDVVFRNTRDNQTGIRLIRGPHESAANGFRDRIVRRDSSRSPPLKRPSKPFRQEGLPTKHTQDTWALTLTGCKSKASFSLQTLRTGFSADEREGLFVCVCRWGDICKIKGVLLRDLVESVGLRRTEAKTYLRQTSLPGENGRYYESSIPLEDAIAHGAMLCYEMNGQALTEDLGWPIRLIDFSLYGYKQVKSLAAIEFTTQFKAGYWEAEAGYEASGRIQPGRITVVGEKPGFLDL